MLLKRKLDISSIILILFSLVLSGISHGSEVYDNESVPMRRLALARSNLSLILRIQS